MRIAPLVLLLSCATFADAQAPAKIAAVRTWGELAAQPLLTLKGGSKVRVGLEAREATRNSSFLVYALVEGKKWESSAGPFALGPLRLKWSFDGQVPVGQRRGLLDKIAGGGDKASKFLFMSTIAIGLAKQVEVKLCEPSGEPVATAVVLLKDKGPDFWTTLGTPFKLRQARLKAQDGVVREFGLRIAGDAVAAPRCDGQYPALSQPGKSAKLDPSSALPRWSFEEPDPRLKLSVDTKGLRIESEMEMDHAYPRLHWLCRVWVNGERHVPEVQEQVWEKTRLWIIQGKKLHIEAEFDPKELGAKKGDRVAVQMLYCWDGWQIVNDKNLGWMNSDSQKSIFIQ